jgi:signal transduction histidine kinase
MNNYPLGESAKPNQPPVRLAWKFAIFTGLLVIFVTLAITYPVYWQTRQALENQLTRQLEQNIQLICSHADPNLVNLLASYPALNSVRDSLQRWLNGQAEIFDAQALYLIAPHKGLLAVAGNSESAILSSRLHTHEISSAAAGQIITSPLFVDRNGQFYKSVFSEVLRNPEQTVILGLDASAEFLGITAKLRRQIFSLTAVVLIISIGMVMVLARTLTRPLENLTDYAMAIGQGRSDLSVPNPRRDEIGFLGQTMQKMHAELSQREKQNKQFLASVAHEIRNPLGGMKINSELLLEETGEATPAAKYAAAIAREVDRLALIVESFLSYARPMEANLITCELSDLLNEVSLELKRDFPEAAINISGRAQVKANPGKLRSCLANLIRNGLEANRLTPQVKVEIVNHTDHIAIHFRNSGSPISPEIRSQIFEAFFSTKADGVGLGLSIAKSLVEQHGGRLYLDHSDQSGTEFVLILPEKI